MRTLRLPLAALRLALATLRLPLVAFRLPLATLLAAALPGAQAEASIHTTVQQVYRRDATIPHASSPARSSTAR